MVGLVGFQRGSAAGRVMITLYGTNLCRGHLLPPKTRPSRPSLTGCVGIPGIPEVGVLVG